MLSRKESFLYETKFFIYRICSTEVLGRYIRQIRMKMIGSLHSIVAIALMNTNKQENTTSSFRGVNKDYSLSRCVVSMRRTIGEVCGGLSSTYQINLASFTLQRWILHGDVANLYWINLADCWCHLDCLKICVSTFAVSLRSSHNFWRRGCCDKYQSH